MMCNLVCSSMGRHVHIDYCLTEENTPCRGGLGAEFQHIKTRVVPNPNEPKDAITHRLFWRRMGFKDPYTRVEQIDFNKCDAMCPGTEHLATADTPGQPSFCTLAMFHQPRIRNFRAGSGYISRDGHLFNCPNPVVSKQVFHVIFVIDRSTSMGNTDRRPLEDAPSADLIRQSADNRLGAVYSALYSFWSARHAVITTGQQGTGTRRDAYSVVLFCDQTKNVLVSDFTSTPDQLLDMLLVEEPSWGTNFSRALGAARTVMEENWSTERTPVMIFLSDGECSLEDNVIQDVCRSAVRQGKPLSFHTVSFGDNRYSYTLRRMTQLALEIQNNAPRDPLSPADSSIPSSYTTALNTVRLTETFLGFAESLRKPRGSLMR